MNDDAQPAAAPPSVERVRELLAADDHLAALRIARRLVEATEGTDDHLEAQVLNARAARHLGRIEEAQAALNAVLAEAPDDADARVEQAYIRRNKRDRDGALVEAREVLDADPDHVGANYLVAVVLQEQKQLDDAVTAFDRTLELDPDHVMAWSLKGVALRDAKRMDEAVDAFAEACRIAPEDLPARNAMVTTLETMGRRDDALKHGLIALETKDRRAFAEFDAAPYRNLKLDMAKAEKPFDPKQRARNVITFSLWGDDPIYVHGAVVNARIAPHLYYGWRCRFYCDRTVPDNVIRELKAQAAEVLFVDDAKLKRLRPLWRFFASDDPEVDRFICRDADSRLNGMELVAVDDWIKSGKPFHIMRDHPYHMELILAGMWGGVAGVLPNLSRLATSTPKFMRNRWSDQEFLRAAVWPLVKDQALIHDSYYRHAGSVDFPPYCRLPRPVHVGGAVKAMKPFTG